MSLRRFEAIRRYLHTYCVPGGQGAERARAEDISEDGEDMDAAWRAAWYAKLEPIANTMRFNYKRYMHIRCEVAIDEMMVKFTGRSYHTTKLKHKPIQQGYK